MARTCTFVIISVALLATFTLTLVDASPKERTRAGQSNKNTPPKVAKIELDYSQGSGEDEIFEDVHEDEDEEEEEDADEDIGISGDGATMPLSVCHAAQMKARDRHQLEVYVPQCTQAGAYSPQQCHSAVHQCWCVYTTGREVPGSRRHDTQRQHCVSTADPDPSKSSPSSGAKTNNNNNSPSRTHSTTRSKQDDVILVDQKDHKNKLNPTTGGPIDISIVNPDMNDLDAKGNALERKSQPSSVLSRPGLLAAVIGSAVIGLVIAVMLVMFVVYRMRKKDEGSYALDEPKSSPMIGYTKTHDREFFA